MINNLNNEDSANTLDRMLLLSDNDVGSGGNMDQSDYNGKVLFPNKLMLTDDDLSLYTNYLKDNNNQ